MIKINSIAKIVLVLFFGVVLGGCFWGGDEEEKPKPTNGVNPLIEEIKDSNVVGYNNKTVKEAFEGWRSCKSFSWKNFGETVRFTCITEGFKEQILAQKAVYEKGGNAENLAHMDVKTRVIYFDFAKGMDDDYYVPIPKVWAMLQWKDGKINKDFPDSKAVVRKVYTNSLLYSKERVVGKYNKKPSKLLKYYYKKAVH